MTTPTRIPKPPVLVRTVWGATFDPPVGVYCDACVYPDHDVCSLTPGCPCCEDTMAANALDDAQSEWRGCRDPGGGVGGGAGPTVARALSVGERETLVYDADVQAYRAGANAARAAVANYTLDYARARASRMQTAATKWVSDLYAQGYIDELAVIEGELEEAVYGRCADCRRELTRGQCEYCNRRKDEPE